MSRRCWRRESSGNEEEEDGGCGGRGKVVGLNFKDGLVGADFVGGFGNAGLCATKVPSIVESGWSSNRS